MNMNFEMFASKKLLSNYVENCIDRIMNFQRMREKKL